MLIQLSEQCTINISKYHITIIEALYKFKQKLDLTYPMKTSYFNLL